MFFGIVFILYYHHDINKILTVYHHGNKPFMFWEKHWSLKWTARGSEDDQRRCGRCKRRRRARVLVWRRIPWIERDGEWELERFLLEWGKSSHPRLWGYCEPRSKLDWLIDFCPIRTYLVKMQASCYPITCFLELIFEFHDIECVKSVNNGCSHWGWSKYRSWVSCLADWSEFIHTPGMINITIPGKFHHLGLNRKIWTACFWN